MSDDDAAFNQREMLASAMTFVVLFLLGAVATMLTPLPRAALYVVSAVDVPAAVAVAYWMRHKRRSNVG